MEYNYYGMQKGGNNSNAGEEEDGMGGCCRAFRLGSCCSGSFPLQTNVATGRQEMEEQAGTQKDEFLVTVSL